MIETEISRDLAIGQQKLSNFSDTLDSFQRNSNWWTIFACFDLSGCTGRIAWFESQTGLGREEIEAALNGLVKLGYLRKDGDCFHAIRGKDFLALDYAPTSAEESLERHALVSQQIINDLSHGRRFAFDHRCFAANDEVLMQLYKDISTAFERAFAKSQTATDNHRVFKMTFTAVDVLKGSSGEKP